MHYKVIMDLSLTLRPEGITKWCVLQRRTAMSSFKLDSWTACWVGSQLASLSTVHISASTVNSAKIALKTWKCHLVIVDFNIPRVLMYVTAHVSLLIWPQLRDWTYSQSKKMAFGLTYCTVSITIINACASERKQPQSTNGWRTFNMIIMHSWKSALWKT